VSCSSAFRMGLIVVAIAMALGSAEASEQKPLPVHEGVGGDFSAASSLGRVMSSKEFRGKVVLLFFGYTSCQDVCPATLAHLQSLTRRLGPKSNGVQVVLVTIDPEVDTAEVLRDYLARFDDRYVGFSGTREETDRIAALFMAKHDQSHGTMVTMEHNRSKAFADSGYLYAHSQQIYLLDRAGRTRAFFFTGSPLGEMEEAVLALLQD
jgi:protein SCO1/2